MSGTENGRSAVIRGAAFNGSSVNAIADPAKAATMLAGAIHLRSTFAIGASWLSPGEEVFNQLLKDGAIQLVANARSVTLRLHELGVSQHSEVARDRGPRRGELLRDLTRRARAAAQQAQDFAPRGIGQSPEDYVGRSHCHGVFD